MPLPARNVSRTVPPTDIVPTVALILRITPRALADGVNERIMKLNVRQIGHVAVVDLSGKITIGEADVMLRERVLKLLENGQKHILLNLREILYMDSAGIGEMFACYTAAKEKDGAVKLLNPSAKVYELLQITKLEELFETYHDETEALLSF